MRWVISHLRRMLLDALGSSLSSARCYWKRWVIAPRPLSPQESAGVYLHHPGVSWSVYSCLIHATVAA